MAKKKAAARKTDTKRSRGFHSSRQVSVARRKTKFLECFLEHKYITIAAREAGIDRKTHYNWMEADEEYAERFREIDETITELAEAELRRRAVEGVDHPVVHEGQVTDTYLKYSDSLLQFYLKARRPERYRERADINATLDGSVELVGRWLGEEDEEEDAP